MIKELQDDRGFSCNLGSERKKSSGWRGMESTKVSVLKKVGISHEQKASCRKRETLLTKQV